MSRRNPSGGDYPLPGRLPEDFELTAAKNGSPTLKAGSRWIHSRYDPLKEAQRHRFSRHNAAVLFGFGLGYSALHWFTSHPSAPLLIIEPEPAYLLAAQQSGILDKLNNAPVTFSTGADTPQSHAFLRSLSATDLKQLELFTTPGRIASDKPAFSALQQSFTTLLKNRLTNIYTELEFERVWFRNRMINGPLLTRSHPFNALHNSLQGKTALLIGAGPGLRELLPVLQEIQHKTVVFTVDTAWRTLLQSGIRPDFVVSLDGQIHNLHDFLGTTPPAGCTLLCDLTVYPAIPALPFTKVYFFETADFHRLDDGRIALLSQPDALWIKQCTGEIGPVRSGGNVTTTALELIRNCGINRIIFAGCDYAYRNGTSHAPGTPAHLRISGNACRWNPAEKQGYDTIQRRILQPVTLNNGCSGISDLILQKYATWTAAARSEADPGTAWYTLDMQGCKLDGVEPLSRRQLSALLPGHPLSKPLQLPSPQLTNSKDVLIGRYRSLCSDLEETLKEQEEQADPAALWLSLFERYPFLKKSYSAQLLHFEQVQSSDQQRRFLYSEISFQLRRTLRHLRRSITLFETV